FPRSVDQIAEVDIRCVDPRGFNQLANGNADVGEAPGVGAEARTFADCALGIRLQIVGTADAKEDWPFSGTELPQSFHLGSLHCVTGGRVVSYRGPGQASETLAV